jgi:hypothetical protein
LATKQTVEIVWACGHSNIQATHPTTLMITKEKQLSKAGDCIIAVSADKAGTDLSPEFKAKLRRPNAKLTIMIEASGLIQKINAFGHPKLSLNSLSDMVIRKSDYTSERTLAVQADKSSNDLPRDFIEKLRNPNQQIKITFIID